MGIPTIRSKDRRQRIAVSIPSLHRRERLHAWSILSERKPNPDSSSERVLLFLDPLHVLLFLLDLCVLGHVLWRGEVVVVPRVNFRIEGGDERRPDGAQVLPFHPFEERVGRDLVEPGEADAGVSDQPVGNAESISGSTRSKEAMVWTS